MYYVYIAPLSDKSAFKVGKTREPERRVKELSRFYTFENEVTLLVCNDEPSAFRMESVIHKMFETHAKLQLQQGGTEFLDYSVYDKVLRFIAEICDIHDLKTETILVKSESSGSVCPCEGVDELCRSLDKLMHRGRLSLDVKSATVAEAAGITVKTLTKGSIKMSAKTLFSTLGVLGQLTGIEEAVKKALQEIDECPPDRMRASR